MPFIVFDKQGRPRIFSDFPKELIECLQIDQEEEKEVQSVVF